MFRIGKSKETKSRLLVAKGLEEWGRCEMTINGYGVSFLGDENVLKLIALMVTLLCKYTKKFCIVFFKWVDYVVCEF